MVLRQEKMALPTLVHIIEEGEDDYSCGGIKQDSEKGNKWMKQLAETSRRRKLAGGRQNMFGKRSTVWFRFIINFWKKKKPSHSCQQSRFPSSGADAAMAVFLLCSFARLFLTSDVQEVAGGAPGTLALAPGWYDDPRRRKNQVVSGLLSNTRLLNSLVF